MKGLILLNVGTPSLLEKENIRDFIGEFLSDPFVMGMNEKVASFLAKKIIAPMSCNKSFKKYQLIWRKEDPKISPLLYYTEELAQKIEGIKKIPTEAAMRYGNPSIISAINKLEQKCPSLEEIIILPMFPHYAESTIETCIYEINKTFETKLKTSILKKKIIYPFYNHESYIEALKKQTLKYMDGVDKLIFCYHSLPKNQIKKGVKKGPEFDYIHQIHETNKLITKAIGINEKDTMLIYSSERSKKWQPPFLRDTIGKLPAMGWKKIAVLGPGFLSDNLETLFDVDIEAREIFMKAGGEKFVFIPSLNSEDYWIDSIFNIIEDSYK